MQQPRVLITAQRYTQPQGGSHHLPNVQPEAEAQQAAFGGAGSAEVLYDISVEELGAANMHPRVGHA